MLRNPIAIGAVLALLTLSVPALAAEPMPLPAEMVTFKLTAYEKTDGPNPKVLASPTIMTVTGREVTFQSAGQVKSKFDASPHDIGTQFTAAINSQGNNKYELKLKATLGNVKVPEQDPDTECFIEQKLTLRTVIESGTTKRIQVSPGRWYEVTVGNSKLMHFELGNGLNSQSPTKPSSTKQTKSDPKFHYEENPKTYLNNPIYYIEKQP